MGDAPAGHLRYGLLLAVLALRLLCVPPQAAAMATQEGGSGAPEPPPAAAASEAVVMLEIEGEGIADSLVAAERSGKIFIPLCTTAEVLSLAVTCKGQRGFGFLLRENHPFVVDLEEGIAISGREVFPVGAAAFLQGADILVDAEELSKWMPVDFQYQRDISTVTARPREPLPIQGMHRRQKRNRPRKPDDQPREYPDATPQRRAASIPTVDLTLEEAVSGSRGATYSDSAATLDLAGDLLAMSGVSHLSVQKDSIRRIDLSLFRRSEIPFWLGPVPATQVSVGTVQIPSLDGIGGGTSSLGGILLSNRPFTAASNFLTHEITGYLPDGWDAELIHNGVPVAYQPPSSGGRYHFDNLRVAYGMNVFKVLLHGPFGELRETTQTLVSDAVTPTGAFLYTIVGGVRTGLVRNSYGNDPDGNLTVTADFGISQNLTGSALFQWEESERRSRSYGGFGIRTAMGYSLVSLDLLQSFSSRSSAGQLVTVRSSSRDFFGMALLLEQRFFHRFESLRFPRTDPPLLSQTFARASTSLTAFGGPKVPVAAEVGIEARRSGAIDARSLWHVSGGWNGWNGAVDTTLAYVGNAVTAATALQISTQVEGTNIRGTAGFSLAPETSPSAVNVSAETEVGAGYQVQAALAHDPRTGVAELLAGLSKRQGQFGYRVAASGASNGAYSIRAGITTSVAKDPIQGQYVFSAQPLAPYGIIAVSATLSAAGNTGARPLAGIGYLANGSRAITVTGNAGARLIAFLQPDVPVDVTVDLTTLEDPFMVPLEEGCRVTPRAGVVSACHFTIVTGGEVDGMVLTEVKGTGQIPLTGVTVNLMKETGKEARVVASTISQDSGYYLFKAVAPGSYRVTIPDAEWKRLGTAPAAPLTVQMPEGGDQVTGQDFVLKEAGDGEEKRASPPPAKP